MVPAAPPTAAAGLRGTDGRVVATLSVTGPVSRLDDGGLAACLPLLLESAARVGALLGHVPPDV